MFSRTQSLDEIACSFIGRLLDKSVIPELNLANRLHESAMKLYRREVCSCSRWYNELLPCRGRAFVQ